MNSLPYSVGQPVVFGPGGGWQKPTMAKPASFWTGSGWSGDPMDEQQDPLGDPLAMPFGGFRQYGGPVDPRFVYKGGEAGPETLTDGQQSTTIGRNGPELFRPSKPGVVIPNPRTGPLSSRAPNPRSRMGGPLSDRGPNGPQDGPLSERGGPTVVNGGMTAARRMKIAERALAGRGDVVGAAQMAGSRLWAERGMPPTPPAQRPVPMGQMPPGPSGKLVPGRSAGSMVWQPNQPVMDVWPDGSVMPPSPRNDVPMPPLPPMEDTRPMAPSPISYDQSPLAPMPLPRDQYNAIAPTAPPGMFGMQPPRLAREDITGPDGGPLGWVGFDQATGKPAGLSGNYDKPQQPSLMNIPGTNRVVPMLGGSMMPGAGPMEVNPMDRLPTGAAGPQRPGVEITPVDKAAAKPPGFTFEKDDNGRITGGVYPIQKEDGSWSLQRVDINGDGKVNAAEAAAAESAAATAASTTASGIKFKRL